MGMSMKCISFVVAAAFATAANAAGLPADEFRNPSAGNMPETWFHFIGGNVARRGITADLEAIKGAGISGIHLFHGQFGGKWPGVEPQITCLSAQWDGLVGFVADECERRGLSFTMQNCPGWAMSGGPWIKPENAMRHIVWKRVDADGGKRIELKLPAPAPSAPNQRDFRDIAVLAFPAPAGDWDAPLKPSKITGSVNADWDAYLKNGAPIKLSGEKEVSVVFEFAGPVTIRTVAFPSVNSFATHRFCYNPDTTVVCEADGKMLFTREVPQANWQDDRPLTFSCDETTAKRVTVILRPRHEISLGRIDFFGSAHNDDWEAQAGWTLRSLMRNPPARQSASAWVKSSEIRDVTALMKPDGSFSWDAPAGRWAIIRVGHANTMHKNAPAPKEGTGFECNKLSPSGADVQFDNYIGRLTAAGGPAAGKMKRMLMDSWECKRQTWTPGLDKVFHGRLGYDLFKHLPAVFGYVVDSPESSARFLNDWRGLLGDLVAENFYARMAKRCHERGMEITFETSFGDVLPGDIMKYYKYADVPMCEYWQPRQRGFVGDGNFKPVGPTVSAARLYGKKSVSAEAFTSFQLTWDEKLRDLKHVANIHMARGVSHMVFHTYTHNPRTDWLPPGTSFGARIGTPFLRGQTWWKFMPDFTVCLGRCHALPDTAVPANDILWYLGDEWDHKPDENAPFPAGYKFDYCNPDALLTRVSVDEKGEWTAPGGISWRILWIPECKRMMPETMEKILEGVKKGGKAAFAALPESISTMRGGAAAEARFAKALAEMKNSKGVYAGRTLESVLAAEKIEKDFEGDGLVWNHRRGDDADWYFVSPEKKDAAVSAAASFRCEGDVEFWHPETGLVEKAPCVSAKNGRTHVLLSLAPHEECFVVFRHGGKSARRSVVRVEKDGKTVFAAKPGGAPKPKRFCEVIEARYGDLSSPDACIDVKDRLQEALDAHCSEISIGNEWAGGDPAYSVVKAFSAKILMPGGKTVMLSAKETETVALPRVGSPALPICGRNGRIIPCESGIYKMHYSDGSAEDVAVSFSTKRLDGPWRVSFPAGWGMPAQMEISSLKPWKELGGTPEAKAFSGTAEYSIDFDYDEIGADTTVLCNLGSVESLVKVELNGRRLGSLWSEPYRIDLTNAIKPGRNTLKLSVTDTWFNRLVFDAGQPPGKRRTWTIAGPGEKQALRDSGLLGPVCIIRASATANSKSADAADRRIL